MLNQSSNDWNRFLIMYRELFNFTLEKQFLYKLVPNLEEIFQECADKIGKVENLGIQICLEKNNFPALFDFKSFVEYVIEHETGKFGSLLTGLLNYDLTLGAQLSKIILKMEIHFLEKLLFLPNTVTKPRSLDLAGQIQQFTHKCKTPRGSEFKLRLILVSTDTITKVDWSKYHGLCYLYYMLKNGKEGQAVTKSFNLEVDKHTTICIIISHPNPVPFQSWMTNTYKQRRNLETFDQIATQLRVCQALFESAQTILSAGLTECDSLFPGNVLIHGVLDIFPSIEFDISIIVPFEFRAKTYLTKFEGLFVPHNVTTKTGYSMGLLMLYSVSAVHEDEFHKLVDIFLTPILPEAETIAKYAPILAASKSLRNMIHRIIHASYNTLYITELEINWTAIGYDFENEDFNDRLPFKEYFKLLIYPVGIGVLVDLRQDFATLRLSTDQVKQLVENLMNEERGEKGHPLIGEADMKNGIQNLDDVVSYVRDKRPWLICCLVSELEIYLSETQLLKLSTSIFTHWNQELVRVPFYGEGKYGFLFSKVDDNGYPGFLSRIMLLLPKVGDMVTQVVSPTFTKIKPKLIYENHHHFYDRIDRRTLYSQQLSEIFEIQGESVPTEIEDIIRSRVYVEFWIIQFRTGRVNLANYLEDVNAGKGTQDNAFVCELIKNLFEQIQMNVSLEIPITDPIPGNIFFADWKSEDGRRNYNLPLSIEDQSLISLHVDIPKNDTNFGNSSTIYKLGRTIVQVLFPQYFSRDVPSPDTDQDWISSIHESFPEYADLADILRQMLDPRNVKSLEYFAALSIESIGLLKNKIPNSNHVEERDVLDLLFEEKHKDMPAKVVNEVFFDIVEWVSLKKNVDWQQVLDNMLISDMHDGFGYFSEIKQNRDKFATVEGTLELIRDGKLSSGKLWFEQILFEYGAFEDAHFKKKLVRTIKTVWLDSLLGGEIELLGHGAFGLVFLAKDETVEGLSCAIKLIVPSDKDEEKYARQEVTNLRDLIHPNVIHMTKHAEEILLRETEFRLLLKYDDHISSETTESEITSSRDPMIMQIEKLIIRSRSCPVPCCLIKMDLAGPNLRQFLTETFEPRKNPSRKMGQFQLSIARDLIRGIKYLQAQKIMHCDLKPDNILFTAFGLPTSDHGEDLEERFSLPVQIADLGLSRSLDGEVDKFIKSRMGSVRYQAPEVQCGDSYTMNAETYSIGLIIMEVLVPLVGLPVLSDMAHKFSSSSQCDDGDVVNEAVNGLRKIMQINPLERMKTEDFQKWDLDWVHLHQFLPTQVQKRITQILEGTQ